MKNINFYAVFALVIIGVLFMVACSSPAPTGYTVSFDSNGGTPASYESQSVVAGGLAKDPGTPIKGGSTFLGWFAEGSAEAWNFASDTVNSNIKLTAHWEKEETTHTITVSWKPYEGATADDTYHIAVTYYDGGVWNGSPYFVKTVAGNVNTCSFTAKDSIWTGRTVSAEIVLTKAGQEKVPVAKALPSLNNSKKFTGTENIVLPEFELIPADN